MKRSTAEGEKQGACSQERRTVCWAEPRRGSKMRGRLRGEQGTSPPPPHPIPYSQQPSLFTRLFRKLLENEMQGKKIDYVFV